MQTPFFLYKSGVQGSILVTDMFPDDCWVTDMVLLKKMLSNQTIQKKKKKKKKNLLQKKKLLQSRQAKAYIQ